MSIELIECKIKALGMTKIRQVKSMRTVISPQNEYLSTIYSMKSHFFTVNATFKPSRTP